jgi:hypothetical protein
MLSTHMVIPGRCGLKGYMRIMTRLLFIESGGNSTQAVHSFGPWMALARLDADVQTQLCGR